ncbi:hypothetical protein B0A50_06514 [Salinomyces thailandicus]|uniref:Uncharacterized protein n=1 Tax=Salinomyces thailandicus TaxID=706561 RepID=A0A4U0TNT6_9PEZI|nr:hypothetical protein B0A50_06514 [Salinomyces thailandica]
MAASNTSLADAKLDRQVKRNQKAEATLSAPVSERQVSRGKNKAWKPFDFTAEVPRDDSGGVFLAHTDSRTNTFRSFTRESSLSRSVSSLSQRTTGTVQSEAEQDRQDSSFAEGGGFQLIKGRKSRKPNTPFDPQLSAYAAKPEEKQTTVEAVPDHKEIYNVFGNPPPPPAHLTSNPGSVNGQLQFIQHTNGDISAHQWSSTRFEWENIGGYSNLRKKIEGQLGSNRLKGETAYQTLQQNTLTYFRTIAKQKEANVMGLPFGPKEIYQLMPELRAAQAPTTTPEKSHTASGTYAPPPDLTIKHVADTATIPTGPRSHAVGNQTFSYETYPGYTGSYGGYAVNTAQQYGYGGPGWYQTPQSQHPDRYSSTQASGSSGMQDPFYSRVSGTTGSMYHGQHAVAPPTAERYVDYGGGGLGGYSRYVRPTTGSDGHGASNYDYHFPPPEAGIRTLQPQQSRAGIGFKGSEGAKVGLRGSAASYTFGDVFGEQKSTPGGEHRTWDHTQTTTAEQAFKPSSRFLTAERRSTDENTANGQRPKPTTPLSASRASMKDQLYKISDQAKERNLSQSDIRTVLYDPFRSQTATDTSTLSAAPPQQASPELKRTVANPSGIPPSSQKKPMEPLLTLDSTIGSSRVTSAQDAEHLRTSSTGRSSSIQIPSVDPSLAGSAFDVNTYSQSPTSKPPPSGDSKAIGDEQEKAEVKKTREAELREWWTNGTTFTRQQELYERISQAFQPSSSARTSNTDYSSQSPAPVSNPGSARTKNLCAAPLNSMTDPMTRLLIPVLENLSSYVQGPVEKRRDYFCPWVTPPDWAIDRSPSGNKSFYDDGVWGQPPARVGRDPRYRPLSAEGGLAGMKFGGFGSPQRVSGTGGGMPGVDRRFAFEW